MSISTSKDAASQVVWTASTAPVHFKCVLCALADERVRKTDGVLRTSSPTQGQEVTLRRLKGKWILEPPSAVFLYAEGSHVDCETRYIAFGSRDLAQAYADAHASLGKHILILSLSELLKKAEF